MQSPAFEQFYTGDFLVWENEFFAAIEAAAREEQISLFQYFNRTGVWPLDEEILVPNRVPPESLLGYWDGSKWTEWNQAQTEQARRRVDDWLYARRQLTEVNS